ncbi:MAG: hypothetical protein HY271_14550 [Deltaproteobacteria bacterium]|nr:hypothetical protein [Deltaproteobacteria bacterium]
MKLLTTMAALSMLLVPISGGAGESNDAFSEEAKQQRAARRAESQDRQERDERVQELQQEHEIEHPAIIDDKPKDDLED